MSLTINDVLELLGDDILSHGFLAQCARDSNNGTSLSVAQLKELLAELLTSGKVEIGNTRLASPEYLEFIAWRGTVDERISRAFDAVDSAIDSDKEFAYWLCLRENVDSYEDEEQ